MRKRIAGWLTEKQISGCLLLILAAPTGKAAAMRWQDMAPVRDEQSGPLRGSQEAGADSGNGKPSVDSAQFDATLPDAPEVAQSTSTGSNNPNSSPQNPARINNRTAARNLLAPLRPRQ